MSTTKEIEIPVEKVEIEVPAETAGKPPAAGATAPDKAITSGGDASGARVSAEPKGSGTAPDHSKSASTVSGAAKDSPASKTPNATAVVKTQGNSAPAGAPASSLQKPAPAPGKTAGVKPAATAKAPAIIKKVDPNLSLVARTAAIMGHTAGLAPASIIAGSDDELSKGFFHCMLYGPPDTWKTSTAAKFMGPERTRIIVTRRKEQMTPLAGLGFKWAVAMDPEALRYLMLYPEKYWPEWADIPDRTLVVDDATEGTAVLVDDHKAYFNANGELVQVKDPRRAYKAAGDEFHDLLKINLNKPQHTIITAVEKGFEVEGTIDYRIEPDIPNKMMLLTETELEFVFHMEQGRDAMLTLPKAVTRMSKEKNPVTKQPDTWREITFAKQKFPLKYAGLNILRNEEPKDLATVWAKIQASLKGDVAQFEAKKVIGGMKGAGAASIKPLMKK